MDSGCIIHVHNSRQKLLYAEWTLSHTQGNYCVRNYCQRTGLVLGLWVLGDLKYCIWDSESEWKYLNRDLFGVSLVTTECPKLILSCPVGFYSAPAQHDVLGLVNKTVLVARKGHHSLIQSFLTHVFYSYVNLSMRGCVCMWNETFVCCTRWYFQWVSQSEIKSIV